MEDRRFAQQHNKSVAVRGPVEMLRFISPGEIVVDWRCVSSWLWIESSTCALLMFDVILKHNNKVLTRVVREGR